jgi:hypothetical protein
VPVGVEDDPRGRRGVLDVRHRRHPLESDEQPVVGGPVAQRAEADRGLGQRAGVVADHLEVPATPTVGHLERQRLDLRTRVVGAIGTRPSPGDLDVGDDDAGGGERGVDPLDGGRVLARCCPRTDVEPDAGVSRAGCRVDPRDDVVGARPTEVVPDEVGRAEVAGGARVRHGRNCGRSPPARSCRTGCRAVRSVRP